MMQLSFLDQLEPLTLPDEVPVLDDAWGLLPHTGPDDLAVCRYCQAPMDFRSWDIMHLKPDLCLRYACAADPANHGLNVYAPIKTRPRDERYPEDAHAFTIVWHLRGQAGEWCQSAGWMRQQATDLISRELSKTKQEAA